MALVVPESDIIMLGPTVVGLGTNQYYHLGLGLQLPRCRKFRSYLAQCYHAIDINAVASAVDVFNVLSSGRNTFWGETGLKIRQTCFVTTIVNSSLKAKSSIFFIFS